MTPDKKHGDTHQKNKKPNHARSDELEREEESAATEGIPESIENTGASRRNPDLKRAPKR